ncbi:uncharacterized protein PG986_013818 [Apiospora aurea]|uniref:F-box domain-containing protein n=1 Tax=Apiospora aurea TaxID=335848 RepID=A0ABR1PWL8_9PEZI
MDPISRLPAEVWCMIYELLHQNDRLALARLCRTCKSQRDFVQPVLYAYYEMGIGPDDPDSQKLTRSFVYFYRTVFKDEAEVERSNTTNHIFSQLIRQTVADRFRCSQDDVERAMAHGWGASPLVGRLPFLLPNLRECWLFGGRHFETFNLARRLYRSGCLPSLPALTVLKVGASKRRPPCGRRDAFRLSTVRPLLDLSPHLQSFALVDCQGNEPEGQSRITARSTSALEGVIPPSSSSSSSSPPTFPASLQELCLVHAHFNVGELTQALARCRNLRCFTYIDDGPTDPRSRPVRSRRPSRLASNCHGITPGQVVDALRAGAARDSLQRLELLSSGRGARPLRDDTGEEPRSIRGDNLGDFFPRLAQVSLNSDDLLFWASGTRGPTAETTSETNDDEAGGRRLLDLLPERTLRILEIVEFRPLLELDLRRLADAVGREGRFPRLRVVRVSVAPDDDEPQTLAEALETTRLDPAQRAVIAELFSRAGVEVVLEPCWTWDVRRDDSLL